MTRPRGRYESCLLLVGIALAAYLLPLQSGAAEQIPETGQPIDAGGVSVPVYEDSGDIAPEVNGSVELIDYLAVAPPPGRTGDDFQDWQNMMEWKSQNPDWIFEYPELMAD